jgi:hypothetical protein
MFLRPFPELDLQVFKAHRIVLQARSEFFKALLNTPMKEGGERRVHVSMQASLADCACACRCLRLASVGRCYWPQHCSYQIHLARFIPITSLHCTSPTCLMFFFTPQITDIEPDVFGVLLHFIYTDSLPEDHDGNNLEVVLAQHLLVAADMYQLTRLSRMCERRLCETVDLETVGTTLALAHKVRGACRPLPSAGIGLIALCNQGTWVLKT